MKKKYKILIVDDDPLNILYLENILEIAGYLVITADSGTQSLLLTEQYQPDLIMLDIMMPVLDGIEVLNKIKSNPATKDIPVIMITASTDSKHKEQCEILGASAFILKPVSEQNILDTVDNTLKVKQNTYILNTKNK